MNLEEKVSSWQCGANRWGKHEKCSVASWVAAWNMFTVAPSQGFNVLPEEICANSTGAPAASGEFVNVQNMNKCDCFTCALVLIGQIACNCDTFWYFPCLLVHLINLISVAPFKNQRYKVLLKISLNCYFIY